MNSRGKASIWWPLLLLWLTPTTTAIAQGKLTIAWFAELSPEHSYWKQNYAFAKAAADDLGVTLIDNYVHFDQTRYRELLSELTSPDFSGERVDAVIIFNMKQQEPALLSILENNKVPGISTVLSMDYERVGQPRERYRAWIGEIVDDEENNGYQLAWRLLDEARRLRLHAPDGTIHMVAVNGKASDSPAIRRAKGLMKALSEQDNVTLHQSFNATNWSRVGSADLATVALKRYPHTSVIWSASDDITLGVLEAAKQSGKSPGQDFLTGGIDGTLDVISKVAAGEVVCTIGGLFTHGGWAVVLLHDYLNGIDFEPDTGVLIRNTNTAIDRLNAQRYLDEFGDGDWSRVDFTRYSKVRTPDLERYEFSIQPLLDRD